MTRSMGDATGSSARSLVAQNPDVFAVYVTGKTGSGVAWGPAQMALIPAGKTVVTIDQGSTGSPVATATVRDVEAGAWGVLAAVDRTGWTALRPTIYLSQSMLLLKRGILRRLFGLKAKAVRKPVDMRLTELRRSFLSLAMAGWQGDVWVALYDDVPALNFPVPPGINVVAKQYTDTAQGGAVDLSVIFDPYWPNPAPPQHPPVPAEAEVLATGTYPDGRMIVALTGTDGNVYVTKQSAPGGAWAFSATPCGGAVPVSVASLEIVFVSGVPSLFIQADPAKGNGDVYTSWEEQVQDGYTWASWSQIA